jgi:hypothetical protein
LFVNDFDAHSILYTLKIDEILSLIKSEIWEAYHEGKEKVHGLTLDKARGRSILARAAQW